MRSVDFILLLAPICFLAACKPPPTDADMRRVLPEAEPSFASDPMPSPDTTDAVWAYSERGEERLLYGTPGEPALVALECVRSEGSLGALRITRLAQADEGAGALLALVGNGHIGRIEVDASEVGNRLAWEGEEPAADTVWEPLAGPRQLTLTVPGAGMVTLNPSTLPAELIETCRGA